MKNAILTIIIGAMFIIALFVTKEIGKSAETQSYAIANDGGYVPMYKVQTNAIRIQDTVEVEWNGNVYSAYVDPESEIQTGDLITCSFIIYEGDVELVDIK